MKRTDLLVLALVLAVVAGGCARRRPPIVVPEVRDLDARPIVVFVPGLTGSVLEGRDSGRTYWGNARAAFLPRDGGYAVAYALDPARDDREPLVAASVIREVRLGPYRSEAFGALMRTVEANGWRVGDLRESAGADFLFFAYDWRRDAVEIAGELRHALEALARRRGGAPLVVTLVGQSSGGHIVRWLLKYGSASLEEAERGTRRPPRDVRIAKAVFLGTSTGGSIRTLAFLHRGRRYVRCLGRRFLPEVLFTFRSLYQDLPVGAPNPVVDDAGRAVEADLFDRATWERFGWSIFRPDVVTRLSRRGADPVLGDDASRAAFLDRRLADARRFHELLDRDVEGLGGARLYAIQSRSEISPSRVVVDRVAGAWRTRFSDDRGIRRKKTLRERTTAPGDGHATLEGLTRFSAQERKLFAAPTVWVEGDHFDIVLDPEPQRRLLEILVDRPDASAGGRP